jgi:hypothetical protein
VVLLVLLWNAGEILAAGIGGRARWHRWPAVGVGLDLPPMALFRTTYFRSFARNIDSLEHSC